MFYGWFFLFVCYKMLTSFNNAIMGRIWLFRYVLYRSFTSHVSMYSASLPALSPVSGLELTRCSPSNFTLHFQIVFSASRPWLNFLVEDSLDFSLLIFLNRTMSELSNDSILDRKNYSPLDLLFLRIQWGRRESEKRICKMHDCVRWNVMFTVRKIFVPISNSASIFFYET